MIVKMEIDLERGFDPWKEMFIDNKYKLNEHNTFQSSLFSYFY